MEALAFWTAMMVGDRVIEAFRVAPAHPVYSTGGGFAGMSGDPIAAAAAEAASWTQRYLATQPRDRRFLLAWARCRAIELSWRAYCDGKN